MNRHEEYFRDLTQDYADFEFNGDDDAYEEYLQQVLPDVLEEMERLSNQGNEFWLKTGKERAMGQLACSILLVNFDVFYDEVCELLGREIGQEEFANPEALLEEAKALEFERANPIAKILTGKRAPKTN